MSDIYTFRPGSDGDVMLIVDAETDYDRNGAFEGEREGRTKIGELYPETTPNMLRALKGEYCFDDVPVADRWGTWISAFAPLHDEDGNVEGALGVDYDAKAYVAAILQMRAGALGMVAVLVAIMISATMLVQVTRAEMARRMAVEKERDQMRHELLLSSHKAGMAEIASGVLHNIGNAMNSVCVSASVIGEKLRMSKASALTRLAGMMHERQADLHTFLTEDSRGREIPDYLSKLASHMLAEQAEMVTEMEHLNKSLDGIIRAIESQQQSAKSAQVADIFEMAALLDNVIRANSATLEKHRVEIVRRYGRCKPVVGNPIKVQQIVTNLISNARQALMTIEGDRQIVLTLEQVGGDDGGCARVVVSDNGDRKSVV